SSHWRSTHCAFAAGSSVAATWRDSRGPQYRSWLDAGVRDGSGPRRGGGWSAIARSNRGTRGWTARGHERAGCTGADSERSARDGRRDGGLRVPARRRRLERGYAERGASVMGRLFEGVRELDEPAFAPRFTE